MIILARTVTPTIQTKGRILYLQECRNHLQISNETNTQRAPKDQCCNETSIKDECESNQMKTTKYLGLESSRFIVIVGLNPTRFITAKDMYGKQQELDSGDG